ncbi:peptidoglycan-binding protein [Streptomyces sp. bgisy082]|uniref:peptidoglycan-binding protein n=1 Tax=Streptomyces sp. bgisy082 TaxID=3413776 RepID=UPI003D73ED12
MPGPSSASRLEMLDREPSQDGTPSPSRAHETPPDGLGRATPASGHVIARTSSPASPSLTSPGASAAPLPTSHPSGQGVTTPPVPSRSSPGATAVAPVPATSGEASALRRHDRGPEVLELQQRLAQLGLWPYPRRDRFNRHLYDAVLLFQADHGIHDDPPGVYGPSTRRQLESMTG